MSPAAVLAAYALASCSVTPADMPDTGAAGRAVEVRLSGYGTSAGQEAPAAEDLQDIAGYLFEDGVFVSETGPFTKDGDLYRTEVDRKSGTLYIVAKRQWFLHPEGRHAHSSPVKPSFPQPCRPERLCRRHWYAAWPGST